MLHLVSAREEIDVFVFVLQSLKNTEILHQWSLILVLGGFIFNLACTQAFASLNGEL